MKNYLLLISSITTALVFAGPSGALTPPQPGKNLVTQDTVKIELEKTSFHDMSILYIPDTAETTQAIGTILAKDYGELMRYINANKLQPLKFVAWYYSFQPPWPMDVAVETDKPLTQTTGRIKSRTQKGGEVLIAHIWGPYDQVRQAYKKIYTWLKDNNHKSKSNPFEVYVNDPSTVKSPREIQTDIYQPIE